MRARMRCNSDRDNVELSVLEQGQVEQIRFNALSRCQIFSLKSIAFERMSCESMKGFFSRSPACLQRSQIAVSLRFYLEILWERERTVEAFDR